MIRRDQAILSRDPKRGTPWPIAVAVLFGCVATAAVEVVPPEKHYQAAQTALARGDTERAKRELQLSLQGNPLDAQAHFLLASLLGKAGELEQAAAGFHEAVRLDPSNAAARYNLGTAMLLRGEPVLAARQLEDALQVRPEYVPAYNNLAKAYFQTGLPELALASYQEALRLDPANPIARKGLALLMAAANRTNNTTSSATEPSTRPSPATAPTPPTPAPAAPEPPEVTALRELIRDLPHVKVEWRGDRLTLSGWTRGPAEKKHLERILAGRSGILDLTGDDVGDPQRLLEVDAILFHVIGIETMSAGHDFLRQVAVNASVTDGATAGLTWLYSASISYQVNIANASVQRIAFLARPHLTTLSGTPATFIAGGDTVYEVSGNVGGNIEVYPFGTSLNVVPTLLRTPGTNGIPRVHMMVKAGRRSVLTLDSPEAQATGSSVYANITVTSEAVLDMNQTLILTGLSQRESTVSRSGVPGLKSIPIIKYLFSERKTITSDLAIIILLTPRDPAFWDEQNHRALTEFVEKRRAFVEASAGTPEDMLRFRARYPDWSQLAPNRFSSHFFLMDNSAVYRAASGMDLANENFDFALLGKPTKKEKR